MASTTSDDDRCPERHPTTQRLCEIEGNTHFDHAYLDGARWEIWTTPRPAKKSSRKKPPTAEINAAVRAIQDAQRNHLGPFQAHSETSRQAAIENYPHSGTQRAAVLAFLVEQPDGATDHEIVAGLGLSPSSVRPRRVELVAGEYVIDSGRERPTPHGSMATVWVATELGRETAQIPSTQPSIDRSAP